MKTKGPVWVPDGSEITRKSTDEMWDGAVEGRAGNKEFVVTADVAVWTALKHPEHMRVAPPIVLEIVSRLAACGLAEILLREHEAKS